MVRQGRREITHFVSGMMVLNPFSDDFCVMCELWEFELALCLLQRNAFWLVLSCDLFTLAPLSLGSAFPVHSPATAAASL